jgi:hypothetical protein
MSTNISFDGSAIALVVRNKKSADDHPKLDDQHADCILRYGAPVGFFGELVPSDAVLLPLLYLLPLDTAVYKAQHLKGFVYTYSLYSAKRPQYVDMNTARSQNVVSAVLRILVSDDEAKLFHSAWAAMFAHPDNFKYAGNNCSTHAARAFARAGIIPAEIPGLDTPDNLYAALKDARSGKYTEHFGCLGFTPLSSAVNDLGASFSVDYDSA